MQDLKPILESILFVADEPLSLERLTSIVESTPKQEVLAALQGLMADYHERGSGFYLAEVAGGWQFRTRPEYHEFIKRLVQPSPQRLSRAALETLSIIAYKQPVIRADIEYIRGVDCGGVLRQLLERKLIRVLGRKEIPGRPLIYATTKIFLEVFDLKNLTELPTPAEIEQMVPATEPQPDADHSITTNVRSPATEVSAGDVGGAPSTEASMNARQREKTTDKNEKALD